MGYARGETGFSIVGILMGTALAGILAVGFSQMFTGAQKSYDSIRANGDLDEIKRNVRIILSRAKLCEASGIVGLTIDPSSPSLTSVTFKSPASTALILKEGSLAFNTRWTTTVLRFVNLVSAGGSQYLGTLRFNGKYRNNGGPDSTVVKRCL